MNKKIFFLIIIVFFPGYAVYSSEIDFNKNWTFTNNENFQIKEIDNAFHISVKKLDKQYIWTGGEMWLDSLPKKNTTILLESDENYEVVIDGTKDKKLNVQLWVVMYDDKKRIGDFRTNLSLGKRVLFKTLEKAKYFRVAIRFSGNGNAIINNLNISKLDKNYFNINFFDSKWSFSQKDKSFNYHLSTDKSLEVNLLESKKKYIWSGDGKFKNKPKEGLLNLESNKYYSISIDGEKQIGSYITFWLIMYDENGKIGHRVSSFDNGKNIYFKTMPGSKYYRFVFQFANSGKVKIRKIKVKKIDLNKIDSNTEEDFFYLKLRHLIDSNFNSNVVNSYLINSDNNVNSLMFKNIYPKLSEKIILDTGITNSKIFNKYIKSKNIKLNVKLINKKTFFINNVDEFKWNINPYQDRNWELVFHNFDWLEEYITENDIDKLNIVGFFIYHWYKNELFNEYPNYFTWNDHALGKRFSVIQKFLDVYINANNVLDEKILESCLNLLMVHTLALSSDTYYPAKVPYNHGLIMDFHLLSGYDFWKKMKFNKKIEAKVKKRLFKQFSMSFTEDSIHKENSPAYHYWLTDMLYKTIELYNNKKFKIDPYLLTLFNSSLYNTLFFIQPNLTFTQFGDTANNINTNDIDIINFSYNYNELNELSDGFQNFLYVFTQGEKGLKPKEVDKIFKKAGYAVFRDKWHNMDSFTDMIVGSFTVNNYSKVHYHEDELSFSLYGYGTEIFVDSGLYNYNGNRYTPPLNKYRYSSYAHNILMVDDEPYGSIKQSNIDGSSKIVDYEIKDDYSWVKGTHRHYKHLGIKNQFRTFIHYKPTTFFIIDEIDSKQKHNLKQIFHFHPDFTEYRELENDTYLIYSRLPNKPKIMIKPFNIPKSFSIKKGVKNKDEVQGWYFPNFNQKVENNVLEIEYVLKEGEGKYFMPVYIKLVAPNEDYQLPDDMLFNKIKSGYSIKLKEDNINFR